MHISGKIGWGLLAILLTIQSIGVPADAAENEIILESEAAVLIEPVSGEILIQKNADKKMHPASVTKLMVILLVLEALDREEIKLTDVVTASPEACKMGGSQIWLEPGEQMTVEELLKAVAIVSANDASYALGEHLAGSEANFIALMNQRARELGLSHTTYVNTTGLEPENGATGNLTSALDMARLAREVLKYPYVLKWSGTWIDYLRGGKSFLRNTNRLVRFYQGCDGLKTGFTGEAGFCLVATAKRDGVRMVAVTMKAPTDKSRAKDISSLFNYGFSKYKAYQIYRGGENLGKVRLFRGREKYVNAVVAGELTAVVKRTETGTIIRDIHVDPVIHAPVSRGQKVGEVVVSIAGKPCGKVDLIAEKEIARSSIFGIWSQILKSLVTAGTA